jgi:hypothetical protein
MNKAELDFFNMFDDIKKSDRESDMFGHYDFIIADKVKVDVKGAKKINRYDQAPHHDTHYIEFRNVRGNKGWVYGEADYIAFEYYDTFVFVKRVYIIELCKSKILDKSIKNYKSIYGLYRREGREDLITLIPTKDLIDISTRILHKNKLYETRKRKF